MYYIVGPGGRVSSRYLMTVTSPVGTHNLLGRGERSNDLSDLNSECLFQLGLLLRCLAVIRLFLHADKGMDSLTRQVVRGSDDYGGQVARISSIILQLLLLWRELVNSPAFSATPLNINKADSTSAVLIR